MVLLALLPLTLLAEKGDAPASDPAADWAAYLANDTGIQPDLKFPYARCFRVAALAHAVPETLLLAVARGESDFDAEARSRANAHGVMQIQWPETARHLGLYRLSELYDPCTNIDAGARYLKELLQRYDGDLHLTLAAYNYGPSRIRKGAPSIPTGANWYSAYIHRHLDYVLGDRTNASVAASLYSDVGRTVLVSFAEPYRAAAFVARFESLAPDAKLDWFRQGTGKFNVVLSYDGEDEFAAGSRQLTLAGFPVQ